MNRFNQLATACTLAALSITAFASTAGAVDATDKAARFTGVTDPKAARFVGGTSTGPANLGQCHYIIAGPMQLDEIATWHSTGTISRSTCEHKPYVRIQNNACMYPSSITPYTATIWSSLSPTQDRPGVATPTAVTVAECQAILTRPIAVISHQAPPYSLPCKQSDCYITHNAPTQVTYPTTSGPRTATGNTGTGTSGGGSGLGASIGHR